MDLAEALEILHLEPGTLDERGARGLPGAQVRASHPDLLGPEADAADATAHDRPDHGRLRRRASGRARVRHRRRTRAARAARSSATARATDHPVPGTSTWSRPTPTATPSRSRAPASEAFALLLDAAAGIGGIGYVDRRLGILEVIVRFEGGPSCSVLITLQGRAFGTDAFCTMESIEAAPTPPIRPVIEALLEALTQPS